jgi:Uma2 family endonuclease
MGQSMELREKLYTVDEFWEYAHLPENQDRRLELDDGIIVDMGTSSPLNSITAGRILTFLNVFCLQKDVGFVTGADGGFKLAAGKMRIPDVGFISRERMQAIPERFEIAPDLAIEVVSEDEDIFKKAREYIQAGTRLVWAVYTDERKVYVFRLNADGSLIVQTYGVDDVLDGGEVLPGFTLPVRDIFPG